MDKKLIAASLSCLAIGVAIGFLAKDKYIGAMSYDECMHYHISNAENPGYIREHARNICRKR